MDREMIRAYAKTIKQDSESLHGRFVDLMTFLDQSEEQGLRFIREMVNQIASGNSGSLIPKTPKVIRKKAVQKIKTIPEDAIINDSIESIAVPVEESEEEAPPPTRSRRAASQKASESIKKQQSLTLQTKLRRPSVDDEAPKNQTIRISRSKRPKTSVSGSDDDDRPSKIQKTGKPDAKKRGRKKIKQEPMESSPEKFDTPSQPSPVNESIRKTRSQSRSLPKTSTKPTIVIDETLDIQENDVTLADPSMYEDAIGKTIPMNSTMNPNTTITIDRKMMNATVILEKINQTITINKASTGSQNSRKNSLKNLPVISPFKQMEIGTKNAHQNRLLALKESMANHEFDAILTDDESSPERAKPFKPVRHQEKYKKPDIKELSSDDEENVPKTPTFVKKNLGKSKPLNDLKYKTNTLFSPYATESVKKKVEAFEQAVQGSPKVDVNAPTRVTRTKTRAMAAAANGPVTPSVHKVTQKLARKSLAKAMKISITKNKREQEEIKENILQLATKTGKYFSSTNDKLLSKQNQRTTPIGKSRLRIPTTVHKLIHTPASQIPPSNKAMTASKVHLGSSTESLLSKPLSNANSTDNLSERKRLQSEEDARKKKEDALKALSEEKKRKREEKELKNRLAREAKEKLEIERRLKMEKEREDKAKYAMIAQEKLKEEAEKKKLAQLQRAQEKEERRKQEEQLRLQKIQEQEEAERLLAEQKRKEQEAERKRLHEARNQQLAALENIKLKAQLLAKAKQMQMLKTQGPQSYVLDSDPDDDESDDESKPKHPIPHWARPEIRQTQLNMQQYISMETVLNFFGAKKCTPDLSELFVGIKKDRLKRTSSANWKTPPRFSMMED